MQALLEAILAAGNFRRAVTISTFRMGFGQKPRGNENHWMINIYIYMGVSTNRGGPQKLMVYFMENPIKMDDLGGPPLFLETPIC